MIIIFASPLVIGFTVGAILLGVIPCNETYFVKKPITVKVAKYYLRDISFIIGLLLVILIRIITGIISGVFEVLMFKILDMNVQVRVRKVPKQQIFF